ncbi:protein vestigial isoform X1 [Osmia bicornis bicornis]|uniref:protein vestigial isoform X1 n=1 Tax=Osmia bicornis bicornis TaxID=1437191 RepID=UPI0010F45506|nr:protein vestigial isoform X1 [Osmia bicornis bicornis]
MSCSEVMYQYYPYLYQRPPPPPHPTHPHAAPHTHPHTNPHAAHHSPARPAPFQSFSAATATHQYDRLNVHQRSLEAAGLEICGAGGSVPQGQPSSAGSVGSAPSPASPRPTPQPRPPLASTTSQPSRTLDDDRSTDAVGTGTAAEDSDDGESRAQYLNPNCVVFTHYRGDAASEVEEHFQRALAHDKLKENISPMSMRSFPASFWNSQHPGEVYEYPTDPWHPHYSQYHHRSRIAGPGLERPLLVLEASYGVSWTDLIRNIRWVHPRNKHELDTTEPLLFFDRTASTNEHCVPRKRISGKTLNDRRTIEELRRYKCRSKRKIEGGVIIWWI